MDNFSYDEISHTKYSVKPSFLKIAIFRKAENVKLLKLWKALVLYFPKIHKFVRRVIHIYLLKISIFTFLLIWIQNFSYKSPRDIYSVRIFIIGLIVSEWVLDQIGIPWIRFWKQNNRGRIFWENKAKLFIDLLYPGEIP